MSKKFALVTARYAEAEAEAVLSSETSSVDRDAHTRFWNAARIAAIDECMAAIERRMKDLFTDSRVHDSAEAMRCLGLLRQIKMEPLEWLSPAAISSPRPKTEE
ncbi:hypothetical protein LJR029_002367 [Caballeronia sp. LjRoot29]|uniref:hypothetical protein n=1 Tax=Caballeronia sp. LjRoot29 TaxID=3342315 RepID=UPI003ED0FA49